MLHFDIIKVLVFIIETFFYRKVLNNEDPSKRFRRKICLACTQRVLADIIKLDALKVCGLPSLSLILHYLAPGWDSKP
jgi:hypothetical protein